MSNKFNYVLRAISVSGTGPLVIMSSRSALIFKNLLLNSRPQPFDKRKSTKILPSMSWILALNTKGIFRLSTVEMVIWNKNDNLYFLTNKNEKKKLNINKFVFNCFLTENFFISNYLNFTFTEHYFIFISKYLSFILTENYLLLFQIIWVLFLLKIKI